MSLLSTWPAPAPITVAILAGGMSQRMGMDKAWVDLGGRPLITWALDHARAIGEEVLVVTRTAAQAEAWGDQVELAGVRVVADHRPNHGPLGGLVTALAEGRRATVALLPVDTPFASVALSQTLIARCTAAAVLLPRWADRLQPLRAVYARQTCLPHLEAECKRGHLKLVRALDGLAPRILDEPELRPFDPDGLSFFNLNTPADLALARARLTAQ
jgi:molybdopterin-guanine dinucleotide biosynthesis protein A